ncbi:pentatricopeptide repeat-containing protein At3g07290, mitochondrial isoform X1 [Prunus avium]|uniref:Pentatricopeptide repeat-containing protein At3g07290, mitochondrial isoform X1 n=2 Tax=Prunus avium TaxID=42229 RepID=A0A6P5SKB1_PRUAV|nr:pentatricopeptide repeat-containing protein At3g07290, mitochondrial isoform X1 [Prunus avium]
MFVRTNKILNVLSRAPYLFELPPSLSSVSYQSSRSQAIPESLDDTTSRVSAFLKQPNWERSNLLKSLVSHMAPYAATKVLQLHGNDIELGVRFFKWVCKHSTYCYDFDNRILLLNLMVSSSDLYVIAQKAIILLIKEFSNSEPEILKLMEAFDNMRKIGFWLSYPCYSSLLMSLASLDLGFLSFLVYKRMVDNGFLLGVIDYRTIINALCKNGFVQSAEMFLCMVLKLGFQLDTHICTSLVLGNCRECNLREASRVFDIMSKGGGCGPNSVTYSILIHGYCQIGKLDEAFHLKKEMSEKGCQPTTRTYTVLIKALCDIGSTDKALGLLDEMVSKGCKPNVHTYTILIDRLCREGKTEEANAMFRKMLKDGLFPGTVTYNALINGYCKEGRVISAFELLGVMEKRQCKPNIRTYNELMEGLCKVYKTYKAMFLLKRVVDNGLLPNRVTYNILIDGFCREGQLGLAFETFKSMSSFGLEPDCFSFTALIDGICKQGRPGHAISILGSMVKKGISPDEVTMTALIDGYCKIGEIGNASMLFGKMVEKRTLTTAHTFNCFLDVLSKDDKVHATQAMLGKMVKYGSVPSVVTYTILVNALCQTGEITCALKMLDLMRQTSCPPNVYTYTVVINGLCQNGRVEEAEILLFSMSDFGIPPNHITYTVLIKALVNAGRLDHAYEILRVMVQKGYQPSTRIYSALLVGSVLSSEAKEEARSVSSSNFVDAGTLPSRDTNDDCISRHVFRNMEIEHAFSLEEKIKRCGGSATDLYNFVVMGLCREARVAEADQITKDLLKRGLLPEKAVSALINRYCKERQYDHCLDFMKTILNHGFVPSVSSYCSVIQGLYSEGRAEQGEELFSDLLRHNDIKEKAAVLPYLEILVKKEEPEHCLDIIKLIEQMGCRERPII